MKIFKNTILPVILAAAWISVSEFVRNEFLVKSYWIEHYKSMGLVFPSGPASGAVWVAWSLLFAIAVYIISKKFSLMKTFLLSWLMGFVLMWIAIWNLGVLPSGLLSLAFPLSLLEAFIAAFIMDKLAHDDREL